MSTLGLVFLVGILAGKPSSLWAQSIVPATGENAFVDEPSAANYIDELPWESTRAAGLGGAILPIADHLDAALYNPAGIGGIHWDGSAPPFLRKLYFPHVAMAANANSLGLRDEFRAKSGASDSTIGSAILDAQDGNRQYARASVAFGMVFNRLMLLPFHDQQVAAANDPDTAGQVQLRYRKLTGLGFGFSTATPDEAFHVGYFGSYVQRSETNGTFRYADIIDTQRRTSVLGEQTSDYTATAHNIGLNWTVTKFARPTVSLVIRNLADTKYAVTKGNHESVTIKEDYNVGFAVSPRLGKTHFLNVAFNALNLKDDQISLSKKLHLGTELLWSGFGSHAFLGIRLGYSHAGLAYGTTINFGLLALEAAAQKVNVGTGNDEVIEQRYSGTLTINVAEM